MTQLKLFLSGLLVKYVPEPRFGVKLQKHENGGTHAIIPHKPLSFAWDRLTPILILQIVNLLLDLMTVPTYNSKQ